MRLLGLLESPVTFGAQARSAPTKFDPAREFISMRGILFDAIGVAGELIRIMNLYLRAATNVLVVGTFICI